MTRALRFGAVLLAALGAFGVEKAAAQGTSRVDIVDIESPSAPSSDNTYGFGEEIRIRVNFTGSVLVSADVKLEVEIGSTTREFDCAGSCVGVNSWFFHYFVQADDVDADGITAQRLTGGTITTQGSGNAATRTLAGNTLQNNANYKVDGSKGVAVASVALNSPPVGDTYERGDVIEATVTFNKAVDVSETLTGGSGQARFCCASISRAAPRFPGGRVTLRARARRRWCSATRW